MDHLDLELAHKLVGGRLDEPTAREIQRHVDACAACRRMVEEERALAAMLRLDQPHDDAGVSPLALDRLLKEVDAAQPGADARRRTRRRLWAAAYAAVVLAAATATWSFWPRTGLTERTAASLGISRQRQNAIVASLDALVLLTDDPVAADEYPTVAAIERLIDEGRK